MVAVRLWVYMEWNELQNIYKYMCLDKVWVTKREIIMLMGTYQIRQRPRPYFGGIGGGQLNLTSFSAMVIKPCHTMPFGIRRETHTHS